MTVQDRVGTNRGEIPTQAFACSIFAMVEALRTLDLTRPQQQRLLEAISDDIKKYTNFTAHRVSEAANAIAQSLEPPVDLQENTWHDQPRFDRGRQRFIVEQINPVSQLRKLCLLAKGIDEVARILTEELRVAWLTREEDLLLRKNGHRFKRPDPNAAYCKSGIRLLP
jgi:hypothetical protein